VRFGEVRAVEERPGIYEIHTIDGEPLKVGIAGNLRKRLTQHSASRGLRFKNGKGAQEPHEVSSKSSILAKHLYFDSLIAPSYDLRTEVGRQSFLEERCRITLEVTVTRAAARELERTRELTGGFRYQGRVVKRR
jgi:hypothetical protein